jgi:hypothetical protein
MLNMMLQSCLDITEQPVQSCFPVLIDVFEDLACVFWEYFDYLRFM